MATVLDYFDWRGDIPFSCDPFGDVDNVALSELVYIDFAGVVPEKPGNEIPLPEALSILFGRWEGRDLSLGAFISPSVFELTKKMAVSPRFGRTKLTAFRNICREEEEECGQLQWSAVTALFEDETLFIAFRGTDDTLISWKEDLHMAILEEIPSQRGAVGYVDEILDAYPGYKVRIGGHSKGGNLAVYAAAKCKPEHRERIVAVYDNDGPGFSEGFLADAGYREIRDRVRDILPEESFVGLLLCHDLPQIVVKSKNKSLFQHDLFSWEVERNSFVRAPALSETALAAERTVKNWLAEMTQEETRDFVNALYKILTYGNARTLSDLSGGKLSLFHAYRKLDPEGRALVADTLRKLLEENSRTVYRTVRTNVENAVNSVSRSEKKSSAPRSVEQMNGSSLYKPGKKKK